MTIRFVLLPFLLAAIAGAQGPSAEIPFERHVIDLGRSEAAAVADIDGDGELDIISGEFWYAGPDWTPHQFRKLFFFNNYIDDFSDLPLDVDSDGDIDIITVTWQSQRIFWSENPGAGGGLWLEHPVTQGFPTEFAFLVDLDNDGEARELLPQFGGDGPTAWFEAKGEGKDVEWVRHVVSDANYGHGIGAGDLNGDGRTDILTPKGWLEAPADPRQGSWTLHEDYAFDKNTGFLHVVDVNGDGTNDIVAPHAHDYGIQWLNGANSFEAELIDDAWSQAHAMTPADLTGDGQPEWITGKRLYAHNGHDPGGRESLGVYWYERALVAQQYVWVRHILSYGERVGGGMQIPVVDIDGDGDLDIVTPGKGGLYLFENVTPSGDRR